MSNEGISSAIQLDVNKKFWSYFSFYFIILFKEITFYFISFFIFVSIVI